MSIIPVEEFKLNFLQIALYFENSEQVVSKNTEFYNLCKKLGFPEGEETVLPFNTASNVPYIIWNKNGNIFQISRERVDIIFNNIYTENKNELSEFKSDIEEYINNLLKIFYGEKDFKIYRVGYVIDFGWFTDNNKLFQEQLKLLKLKYIKPNYFDELKSFNTQIGIHKSYNGKAFSEVCQISTQKLWDINISLNKNVNLSKIDTESEKEGYTIRKDFSFFPEPDNSSNFDEVKNIFNECIHLSKKQNIYKDLLSE